MHVVKLHVDGWDNFRLCFGIFMSFLLSRDLLMCCLCDLYIKADSRNILTQQRKDLGWRVLSA